jgi:hypothetical protein
MLLICGKRDRQEPRVFRCGVGAGVERDQESGGEHDLYRATMANR